MNSWAITREGGDEPLDVNDVTGQNRFRPLHRHRHEVCVDDVHGAGPGKDRANNATFIESVNRDGREKSRETCLSRAVAPHLCDNRMRGPERRVSSENRMQELLGGALAAVD